MCGDTQQWVWDTPTSVCIFADFGVHPSVGGGRPGARPGYTYAPSGRSTRFDLGDLPVALTAPQQGEIAAPFSLYNETATLDSLNRRANSV